MTSWYSALDRLRAHWAVRGGRADLVAAGILLVLAVAAFAATSALQ
ncbi:hypothetical protein [Kribbella sp. NPDC000426]